MTDIVERLGRRIHNQRVRLRYWEELFNQHVHAHLHALHPRHLKKAIELGNENFRLRQLLSEAETRERETLTHLSELAKKEAEELMDKWISDKGATVDTKAAGVASHIVNDFRGHIEGALIKLERRAALESALQSEEQ